MHLEFRLTSSSFALRSRRVSVSLSSLLLRLQRHQNNSGFHLFFIGPGPSASTVQGMKLKCSTVKISTLLVGDQADFIVIHTYFMTVKANCVSALNVWLNFKFFISRSPCTVKLVKFYHIKKIDAMFLPMRPCLFTLVSVLSHPLIPHSQ